MSFLPDRVAWMVRILLEPTNRQVPVLEQSALDDQNRGRFDTRPCEFYASARPGGQPFLAFPPLPEPPTGFASTLETPGLVFQDTRWPTGGCVVHRRRLVAGRIGVNVMPRLSLCVLVALAAMVMGCETSPPPATTTAKAPTDSKTPPPAPHVRIQSEPFGDSKDGLPITRYLLSNDNGLAVSIIDYGASITEIDFPDRNKKSANITLGFPSVEGYLNPKQPYFGPICGRYANRIA
jgi:hypothetical protein